MSEPHTDAVAGALLGTAVGDALGLPYEGLPPARAERLLGPPDRYRFLFRAGMVSDDTEHACMTARALAVSGGDEARFRQSLGWSLRWWLLGLPAGVGLATLRACVKLWLGFPPSRSGVYSAGNGPAMRSAIIGAALDDEAQIAALVRASTRVTHTDPKAFHGALAVALAAKTARETESPSMLPILAGLHAHGGEEAGELIALLTRAADSALLGESTRLFAAGLGLERGVTGYVMHSVPCALHAWLLHPRDLDAALRAIIAAGGDADTTAAMTGGVVGAAIGADAIDERWLAPLLEWPRTVPWMRALAAAAARVAAGERVPPRRLFAPWLLARNAIFMAVVLLHGLRRALPPY